MSNERESSFTGGAASSESSSTGVGDVTVSFVGALAAGFGDGAAVGVAVADGAATGVAGPVAVTDGVGVGDAVDVADAVGVAVAVGAGDTVSASAGDAARAVPPRPIRTTAGTATAVRQKELVRAREKEFTVGFRA
jgi:hypothetical protein